MNDVTLAVLLTASGAVAAAAIVRQLTELLKRAFPFIDARASGATLTFVLCAGLYTAAWIAVGSRTADGIFVAFLAWLSCATSSIGINSTIDHVQAVRNGTRAMADDPVPLDEEPDDTLAGVPDS